MIDTTIASEVTSVSDAIHERNLVRVTYIEAEYLEVSPPTAVRKEVFPLFDWLDSNGWSRDWEETHSYCYYKLTDWTYS